MEEELRRIKSGGFEGAAYFVRGEGYPVMLVHGFPADHHLWRKQMEPLGEEYKLLLPDLPGSGDSPLIDPISITDMGRFLKAILDQENIKKCVVIGHSMGGYSTLALAETAPEILDGWGLFHSSAYADNEERKKGRKRSIQMMKDYGPEQFLCQMLPNLFSKAFKNAHRDKIKLCISNRVQAGIDALIPYYRAMWERPDRTEVLKAARVPVLFIIGKEDIAAPMDSVLEQVSLPVTSEVHLLDDCGHMGMLEKAESTTRILKQFIQFCIQSRKE